MHSNCKSIFTLFQFNTLLRFIWIISKSIYAYTVIHACLITVICTLVSFMTLDSLKKLKRHYFFIAYLLHIAFVAYFTLFGETIYWPKLNYTLALATHSIENEKLKLHVTCFVFRLTPFQFKCHNICSIKIR